MTRLSKRFDSDFDPNAFVVDPSGCGCTDCITGMSTPENELSLEQVSEALELGMRLVDRR